MTEHPDDLLLLPPQDEITRRAGTFPAPLYRIKIKGNIYGLASAPRTWYKEVARRFLAIGFKQHSLDRLMFYLRSPDNQSLLAIAIVYVDDVLLSYREDFDMAIVLKFTWGSAKELNLEQPLEFKGKGISLLQHQDKFHVKVTQKQFLANSEPGRVKKGRIQEGPPLSAEEQTEFRSVTGALQWLAGQTRPELAAWVSLANKGQDTGPAELRVGTAVRHLGLRSGELRGWPCVAGRGHQQGHHRRWLCRQLLGQRGPVCFSARVLGAPHNPALHSGDHQGELG